MIDYGYGYYCELDKNVDEMIQWDNVSCTIIWFYSTCVWRLKNSKRKMLLRWVPAVVQVIHRHNVMCTLCIEVYVEFS